MIPSTRLNKTLRAGGTVKGFLATMEITPQLVEIAASVGSDYLIADCEHHPWSAETLAEVCRAGRMTSLPIIIRVPAAEATCVRQAMDLGPAGIMLPCVDSPAQLDVVSHCLHVPPRGSRRPGGQSIHWLKSFAREDWQREIEQDFLVWPQIENAAGVEHAAEIANHPVTSSLALGPYDLALDLGIPFSWTPDSQLTAACSALVRVADEAGKGTWSIGPMDIIRQIGIRVICLGEPTAMMGQAMLQAVENAGKTQGEAPSQGSASDSPYWASRSSDEPDHGESSRAR